MEPMSLSNSPLNAVPSSPTGNPPFLPAFLMGEQHQSTPIQTQVDTSPGPNRHSVSFRLPQNGNEPKSLRQKLFNQSLNDSYNSSQSHVIASTTADKSGPPKQGLFDTLDQKRIVTTMLSSTKSSFVESPITNRSFSRMGHDSCVQNSSVVEDSFNQTQPITSFRGKRKDTLWVTIFGFPPSVLSVVLAHMAAFGNITDKIFPTQGNWVHIKYSTEYEVSKALSFNGKVITNNIMIGVVPYYKNKEDKENVNTFHSPTVARSLRHSVISPQIPVSTPQNVPQKSTGLVTKAMEYVFGW